MRSETKVGLMWTAATLVLVAWLLWMAAQLRRADFDECMAQRNDRFLCETYAWRHHR